MLTFRYNLEVDLKATVTPDSFKDKTQRVEAKKKVRQVFEERYNGGKNKWFFEKLRF
jgi:large subunit ribosomal protein L27e